ncbi:MAG TPA: hypothetical protein P5189_04670, partial [Methanomassiliicoccales archaeon]|nr:hypothetical protein [Methanomassiliicoccales archaeon]
MEVDKDFITVVLNEALMAGKRKVVIRSDLMETDLLAVDLDRQEVQLVVQEDVYDEALSRMARAVGDRLAMDLPNYLDLREALQASLLL